MRRKRSSARVMVAAGEDGMVGMRMLMCLFVGFGVFVVEWRRKLIGLNMSWFAWTEVT